MSTPPSIRDGSSDHSLALEILYRRITRGGREIAITPRELEVLVALAIDRGRSTSERLADRIWPDVPSKAGINLLKTYVCRIRKQVGQESIVTRGRGYALSDGVRVDLETLERCLKATRWDSPVIDEPARAILSAAAQVDLDDLAGATFEWDWFRDIMPRIEALTREAAVLIARAALVEEAWAEAARHASQALVRDPCDEGACEVALTALGRMGDRIAALRLFRQFERSLRIEFGIAPSDRLRVLVQHFA